MLCRLACLCLLLGASALSAAPESEGRRFQALSFNGSNDQYGDANDRWRTTSLQVSALFGPDWTGGAPHRFGDLLEVRARAEILAPESLTRPDPEDRPYAAIASLGLHTHMRRGETDLRLGADLVFVGPQTGLDDLQATLHELIPGQPRPDVAQENQIGNTVRLALSGEAARAWDIGSRARIRPFAEVRTGDEVLARVGADLIVGRFGEGGLILRDQSTGQLYDGIPGEARGLSLVVGGDIAAVAESIYLPEDRLAELSDTRTRARAMLHWQNRFGAVQYGFTWYGPEFEQQPQGQVVGSASVIFRF